MSLEEIRELCAKYWNPIGIPMMSNLGEKNSEFRPLPIDEYDSYLIYVLKLLEDGASSGDIYKYLETVEREYLMLSAPDGDKSVFIRELRAAS